MEALALLGLVVSGLVRPLLQLVRAVGERTRVWVFACAAELPEFANFCLELHFEALFSDWRFLLSRTGCISVNWCFICRRAANGLCCLCDDIRSFLLYFLTSCICWGGRLVDFDGHILKEFLGCGRFEMITKAVIFPGLSLSLIFKILLLDRCFFICIIHRILTIYSSNFRLNALSHWHWHGHRGSLLVCVSIWLSRRWGSAIIEGCPWRVRTIEMVIDSSICLLLIMVRHVRRLCRNMVLMIGGIWFSKRRVIELLLMVRCCRLKVMMIMMGILLVLMLRLLVSLVVDIAEAVASIVWYLVRGLLLEHRGRDGSHGAIEHLIGIVRCNGHGLLLGADHVPQHIFQLECHTLFCCFTVQVLMIICSAIFRSFGKKYKNIWHRKYVEKVLLLIQLRESIFYKMKINNKFHQKTRQSICEFWLKNFP